MLRAHPHPRRGGLPLRRAVPISHPGRGGLPQPGPVSGVGPGHGPGADPYNTSADATLQGILALLSEQRGSAQASALSARKQLAIDYGDPALVRSLGLDASTLSAASQNPFSVLAKERLAQQNEPRQLNENLNARNLFYSSTAGQEQSNLARNLLERQAGDQAAVRGRLSGIEGVLAQSLGSANEQEINARQAAADRLRAQLGDLNVQPQQHLPGQARARPVAPRRRFATPGLIAHPRPPRPRY